MASDPFPSIHTERLELISLSPAFLEASLSRNVEKAERLLGQRVPPEWFEDRELIEWRLSDLYGDPTLQEWLLRAICLRDSRVMIGHIGFHTAPNPEYLRDIAPGGIESGYTVFTEFRGRGYAREACMGLMQWATRTHHLTRFVLSISPDNQPSLRIAQRLGYTKIAERMDEIDGLEHVFLLDLWPPI